MPDPARFEKSFEILRCDEGLGIVYGWGAVFTKDGAEYFDTQGDAIDPGGAEEAALEFVKAGALAGEMHEWKAGTVPFVMPIGPDQREAFGIQTDITGLAIGMRPSPDVYAKFRSGEYTGFSIGGTRISEEVVEPFAKRATEPAGKYRQGKKRRMKKFRIDEISAVDRAAQKDARALLMKRGDDVDRVAKRAMMTSEANGHAHIMTIDHGGVGQSSGFTSYEDSHAHPWILKADGTYSIGAAQGHAHEEGPISISDEDAALAVARKRETTMPEDLDKLTKRLDRAEKLATLTDAHKAHFAKLDETAQAAFLALDVAGRQGVIDAEVRKANEADPVVATLPDGTAIRKSADPVLIALARQSEADRAEISKLRTASGDVVFRKRAESELANLPGSIEGKAAILKSLDALPEAQRAEALAAVTAGDRAMTAAFKTVGYSKREVRESLGAMSDAEGAIRKRADEIRKADPKLSAEAARVQAEDEMPEQAEAALAQLGVN